MNNDQLIIDLKEIITPYTEEQLALAEINEQTDFLKDLKINSATLLTLF